MIEFNVSLGKSPQINSDTGGIPQTYAENTYEKKENKVTSLSAESTNEQYPSAKVVYDTINATSNTIEDKITKSISSVMTYKGSITADNIASIYSDTVASVVSELKTGYTFNLTSTWKNNYIPLACLKIPSGFTVSFSYNQDGYNMYQIYFTPDNAELWKTKSYGKIFNKTAGKLYDCVYYSMEEYSNQYQVVAMVSENDVAPTTTDELYWGEFGKATVGDNIAWNGTQFDILSGYIDTSDFATKTQLSDTKTEIENDVNAKLSTVYKYKGNIADSSSSNSISYSDLINKIETSDFPKNGEVYNVATSADIYIPVNLLDLAVGIYGTSSFSMSISSDNEKHTATVTYRGSDSMEFNVWYQNLSMFPRALLKLAYKKTDTTNAYAWYLAYNFNKTNSTCTFDFEVIKHVHDNEYIISTSINPFNLAFGAEKCSTGDNVASKWDGDTQLNDLTTYYTFDKLAATVDLSPYATKEELKEKADVSALTAYEPKSTVADTENASETLVKNFIFNFGERTAITITLPATVSNDFITGFTFISGATPTSLTMPTEIKFSGVDCFDGSFTPTANKTYQVIISRVANEFWGDVDARDYTASTEETA